MGVGALKSVQETNRTAVPIVLNKPMDGYGKLRRLFFNYVCAGADLAAGSTIDLVKIPAGCRFLGGIINVDAGFADANADGHLGITGGTVNKYGDNIAVETAGAYAFGNTLALYFGEEITTEFILTLMVDTGALLAGGILKGHVDILVE